MPVEILMPALSPTMTEGTLAKWCKAEGDAVKMGELLAEIETDKAIMEMEATDDGIIGQILVPAGTKGVKVNSAIGVILLKGEDKSVLKDMPSQSPPKVTDEKNVLSNSSSSSPLSSSDLIRGSLEASGDPRVKHEDDSSGRRDSNRKIFASPLAKRLASQNDLDLSELEGSGPRGRIIKSDVLERINNRTGTKKTKTRQAPSKVEVTGLRKAIAQKLTEVKQNAPHFYLSMDVSVDKLLEMRVDINKDTEAKQAPKVSVNDLVVKAIALAFKDMPEVNLAWQGSHIEQYHNVDASVAVSVDGGIFTPIIKDADQKSVFEISKEVKALAARAKAGELRPEEFMGGSFTVSNLGMYGIDRFTAILNPPQSSIFAVGAAKQVPVVKGDKIVIGSIMNITISCDHRAVDGAVCAQLMNKIKDYLENPFRLLI